MKYTWKNGQWLDRDEKPMEVNNSGVCMPMIQSDLPGYMSVVTNKWIDGRRDRRYDLESTNSRPLEPEEGKRWVTNKKLAEKTGREWNNDQGAGRPKHWGKDWSSKRKQEN